MDVLLLGGTGFIGRHAVRALQAAGHRVSVLARGLQPDAWPADVECLRGDRDAGAPGLQALAGRRWQACVDLSGYTPRQVRPAAAMLAGVVQRYVYVSAVMVYGDATERPVRETTPRLPPVAEDVSTIDGATYGPLKVACEDLVQQLYGERCTVLRPQVVTGPQDPSGRFAYWLQRARRGGAVLAPGDGRDHLQALDVRDLARFVVTVLERGLAGAWNLAGPRLTWAQFMALLGVPQPVWVASDRLQAAGLGYRELPLFRREGGPFSALMDVSSEKAQAAGLQFTDTATTLRDLQAVAAGPCDHEWLSPEREAALIAAARGQPTH